MLLEELSRLESEFEEKKKAILTTVEVLRSGSNGKTVDRAARPPAAPPTSHAAQPLSIAAAVTECAKLHGGVFSKDSIEELVWEHYPATAGTLGKRSIATALQKLALKGTIERVQTGENGLPSTFRWPDDRADEDRFPR